jgi:hypothetical protein
LIFIRDTNTPRVCAVVPMSRWATLFFEKHDDFHYSHNCGLDNSPFCDNQKLEY